MQVESRIQKWGNGLAIRVSGMLRTVPHFKEGDLLLIDIKEDSFTARKINKDSWSEQELLSSITTHNVHADLTPNLISSEYE